MLATTEEATVVAIETVQQTTKEGEFLKTTVMTTETTAVLPVPVEEDIIEAESEEDDEKMDEGEDDEAELEMEENDLVEIDASNIINSRTRGVKIDFANLPQDETMAGLEEDDEDDADVVMDEE
ncbi:uncharacterized protein EV422DRAFT_565374 [Fimicolochytrium jonesii]|uniref:uncharacterized protein n=1 Tax=Fimicolochytrium jonesii TaxID=1396493 RepID=UPI0022FE1904|nr:uncharacterized protein EV422DRAFT_565374 [Fimicolochytrium jonesii]KAI8823429.1 hypothetical protein EV422DRAFT_565374 [Fimicolochytrium jonesii]